MGVLSEIVPEDHIILIFEFNYDSRGKTKYLPNDIRRFLVGKAQQTGKKIVPGIPEKASELGLTLIPLHFSLIKYPYGASNRARGAIVIYRTVALTEESLYKACKFLKEEVLKRFGSFCRGVDVLVGRKVKGIG